MNSNLKEIEQYLIGLQNDICDGLSSVDGESNFQSDKWERSEGGGGDTRVIKDGAIYEKGGVNFSHVFGAIPDFINETKKSDGIFHATGVSIVIHPQNPFVPIIHMNVRYFELRDKTDNEIIDAWFGGGIDVSPAYPNKSDTKFFHQFIKQACDEIDESYYPFFKKTCDEYFYIQHRKEMRGISGIFYDHLRPKSVEERNKFFHFMQKVGNSFLPIYKELSIRNKDKAYNEENKKWQFIRRGRYAEFNLVYDRGTHFGLKTNGRIESILMSLPPMAEWVYDYHPEKGTPEEKTLAYFQPKEWV